MLILNQLFVKLLRRGYAQQELMNPNRLDEAAERHLCGGILLLKLSGAAVVVAPGGGFRTLSTENEGWEVARALAQRGVAAFILK